MYIVIYLLIYGERYFYCIFYSNKFVISYSNACTFRIVLEKLDLISDLFSGSLVVADSVSPPTPTSIIHLMSIGFESLVLEMWLDLKSGKIFAFKIHKILIKQKLILINLISLI